MEEEKFLEKMSYDGWELFFINNEPVDGCPKILIKFYFRKEINYLYEFFSASNHLDDKEPLPLILLKASKSVLGFNLITVLVFF